MISKCIQNVQYIHSHINSMAWTTTYSIATVQTVVPMKELPWKISEWAFSTVQRSLPSTCHKHDLEEGRHSPDMYGGPHGGHPQGQPTSCLVCSRWSHGRDWRWWPPYPFPWHRSQTPLPSTWSTSQDLRIRWHCWGGLGKGACVRNLPTERTSSPLAGSRSPLYHRHGVLQDHS